MVAKPRAKLVTSKLADAAAPVVASNGAKAINGIAAKS